MRSRDDLDRMVREEHARSTDDEVREYAERALADDEADAETLRLAREARGHG